MKKKYLYLIIVLILFAGGFYYYRYVDTITDYYAVNVETPSLDSRILLQKGLNVSGVKTQIKKFEECENESILIKKAEDYVNFNREYMLDEYWDETNGKSKTESVFSSGYMYRDMLESLNFIFKFSHKRYVDLNSFLKKIEKEKFNRIEIEEYCKQNDIGFDIFPIGNYLGLTELTLIYVTIKKHFGKSIHIKPTLIADNRFFVEMYNLDYSTGTCNIDGITEKKIKQIERNLRKIGVHEFKYEYVTKQDSTKDKCVELSFSI